MSMVVMVVLTVVVGCMVLGVGHLVVCTNTFPRETVQPWHFCVANCRA